MAGKGDIQAGGAFVRLFLKDEMTRALVSSINKAGASMQSFGASAMGIGARIGAAGAGMSAPFLFAISAASDLEETMSKFGVVFGDRAKDVKAWGDELAGQIGRGEKDVAGFLAANQDLFVPLGFDPTQAESLSKQLVGLTYDLASFNNIADADVQRDLQAALTGSGEVMKKYGVIVSEAAVKQEMINQGLDPKKATEQQKVQARLAIIMRGTTAAQGDALRTAGGFANQMKGLKGSLSDVAAEIGSAILPYVTKFVSVARKAIKTAREWIKDNHGLIVAAAAAAAGIFGIGVAITGLGAAAWIAGAALSAIAAVLGVVLSPVGLITAALVGGIYAWARYTDSGKNAVSILGGLFGELLAIGKQTFGGIYEALSAGDLQLAGQIAFAGLKLAAAEGLDALRGLVGDSVAGIGGMLLSGDISGAWQQTLKVLGSMWANWSQAVVNVFTDIARKIVGVWQKATTSIASGIIALGKNPAFAKAFELATGVNIQEQQKLGEGLNKDEQKLIKDRLKRYTESRQAATTDEDKAWYDKEIEGLKQRAQALQIPYDFAADVQKDAASQIDGMTVKANDYFNELDNIAAAEAAQKQTQADAGTDDGITAISAAARLAREELDALTAKAAEAKGITAKTFGGEEPRPGEEAVARGGVGGNLVTFSAAAAEAAGFQGSGPAEKMAADIAEMKRLARVQERLARKMGEDVAASLVEFSRLSQGLVYR